MKNDFDYQKGRSNTEEDVSEISSMSSYQSVDEGAISVLSVDQIRNMRSIQMTLNPSKDDDLGMELDSDSDTDEDNQIKLPDNRDNVEHHRHISKLEQSDDCIAEDVNLEEVDSDSVAVPVSTPDSSDTQKEEILTNNLENNSLEEDLEK